ncbi:MAG TPA: hypothetical protein VF115_01735 [Acidimicrobiia bacterium]
MASRDRSWIEAGLAGLAIVAYFALTTVWVPSWVLRMSAVAQASQAVSDLVGTLVWAVFLLLGMWGLRLAQRRGWI